MSEFYVFHLQKSLQEDLLVQQSHFKKHSSSGIFLLSGSSMPVLFGGNCVYRLLQIF